MGETSAQLAKLNKRVADGARAIDELQSRILTLRAEGKDTAQERELLGEYHARQLSLTAERERVLKSSRGKD